MEGKINHGFTLVELLVVIGTVGALATFLIMLLNPVGQFAKARDANRKNDLHQIKLALDQYYSDHNRYPIYCEATVVDSSKSQPWISELAPYLKTIPVDPLNTWGGAVPPNGSKVFLYEYQTKNIGVMGNHNYTPCDATGQHFELGAHLENSNDKQINWDFYDFSDGWWVNYVVTSDQ